MKSYFKLGLLVLTIYTTNFLHAELLVIKRTDTGLFTPLDASDARNKAALARLFIDYQWPQVIANGKLTRQEIDELLTAGKANAEEEFFRAKVKRINPNYDIVFIPTSLYEIFLATKYSLGYYGGNPSEQNPFQALGRHGSSFDSVVRNWDRKPPKSMQEAYKEFYGAFKTANAAFYPDAFMYINNALAETMFSSLAGSNRQPDAASISNYLQAFANNFAATLLKQVPPYYYDLSQEVPYGQDSIRADSIIAKVIMLEYDARAKNKALLLRGSSPISIKGAAEEKESISLLGSVLSHGNTYFGATTPTIQSLATAYKKKSLQQHSVSLANSLFAGLIYDKGACAYFFLKKHGVGYGLFINKRYYYKNQFMGPTKSLDLFFIAPLCDMAAFFAAGGLFHSRTKVTKNTWNERVLVDPFLVLPTTDPFGVLTTVRDPLINARLFSQFLAKNMVIIKTGDDSNLLPAERRVYEAQIKLAQEEAAKQLRLVQKLQPVAARLAEHTRERIRRKKQVQAPGFNAKDVESRKQQLLSRLTELRDVTMSNKLAADWEVIGFLRELMQNNPYNAETLTITVDALRGINPKQKIKYFGQPTEISFLLEPLIATLNRDLKELRK